MVIVECDQYSPTWWEARRALPTASEFHRIITASKMEYAAGAKSYIYELIADLYNPGYGPKDSFQTAAMRNGAILEPRIRRLYEFQNMCDVRQVGFCKSDDGRVGCSPDSLVGDDGVLEIKAPEHKTQVAYLLAGVLPPEYRAQCHGHLIVTGRKWCDFVSHAYGLPDLVVRVEPDDFTEKLRECLGEFLNDYDDALAKIREKFGDEPPMPIKTESYGALGTIEVGPYQEAYF